MTLASRKGIVVVDPLKLIAVAILGIPTELCGEFLPCMFGGLSQGKMHPRLWELPLFVGAIVVAAAFAGLCIWGQEVVLEKHETALEKPNTVLEPEKLAVAPHGRRENRVILISAFLGS